MPAPRPSACPDSTPLRDARAEFFRRSGFDDDGGDSRRWVRVETRPFPVYFPNFDARRRSLRFHDVHHVIGGYPVDWRGETEIAAWEIGAGCGKHWVAWALNFGSLCVGLIAWPRSMHREFMRGRATRSLYHEPWRDAWLDEPVGAMRTQLGLDRPTRDATIADRLLFALWALAAVGALVLSVAAPFSLMVMAWNALAR